jgi:hypothetical protein
MFAVLGLTHLALCKHGLLAHSSMSTSQLPLAAPLLSITEHCALYCGMKPGTHAPFVNPAAHAQRYALMEILALVEDSVHAAPFLHGLLAHSSASSLQLPPV